MCVWGRTGSAYHNMRKVIHQCQSLSRDLPVQWASSIFVAQDEDNFSALKHAPLSACLRTMGELAVQGFLHRLAVMCFGKEAMAGWLA